MVYDAEWPPLFPGPALCAVRGYVARCFGHPLRELALDIAGLRPQFLSLMDYICRSASYSGADGSKPAEL